jgi:hypothetical protein
MVKPYSYIRVHLHLFAARCCVLLCVVAPLGALVSPALAQAPELTGTVPAGGQRGTTITVQIDGKNLQAAKLFVSGGDITISDVSPSTDGTGLTARLSLKQDAPVGPREIRAGTAKGVSNPVRIWVDNFPGGAEKEPNDDPARAQAVTRAPGVIGGRIGAPQDRDVFVFQAAAGETWVFDCNAARLRSRLDPVLELRDAKGSIVKMAQSVWERDPRLIYTFKKAGRFFLTVRDTQFLGGPDYIYRLTAGVVPVITGFKPRGGRPGTTLGIDMQGHNIGTKGRALVPIPAGTPAGEYWTPVVTDKGATLPIPILIDTTPVASITETDANMPLPLLPGSLDGSFLKYPRIKFFFRATPDERIIFDLYGRRIGSRIDGAIRITDAAGKEVAVSDDTVDKDARLVLTPPKDDVYNLEAYNVEEKVGPDCFYRLQVTRIAPDFRVMLNADRLQVGAGGTSTVTVAAERLHGFNGPIEINAEDLPKGVITSGGIIAPGQTSVEVSVTAAPDAVLEPSVVRFYGTATLDGTTVRREAPARSQYTPRSIDPGMFTEVPYVQPYREWALMPLGITERAEPFSLSTEPGAVSVTAGSMVEVSVKVERKPGADGEIKLELRGLPEKVTASASAIVKGQNEARITLTAAADAPATVRNLIIQGRMDKAVQPAPAIRITVTRPASTAGLFSQLF